MTSNIACVFPGQGSQYVGMLSAFEEIAIVRHTFEQASEVLSEDLWLIAQEDPVQLLHQTQYTQPILLTSGVALYRFWQQETKNAPLIMAGHSLGEYTALVASGALDFDLAVRWVRDRAEAMQQAVPESAGGMGVIVGFNEETVRKLCVDAALPGEILEAVNINADQQIAISGHARSVDACLELAKRSGAKLTKRLPVSVPSHCKLMEPAARQLHFSQDLIGALNVPVLRNIDAMPHIREQVVASLMAQLTMPVLWSKIVQNFGSMIDLVLELGPGNVLSGLHKRITGAPGQCIPLDHPDRLRELYAS